MATRVHKAGYQRLEAEELRAWAAIPVTIASDVTAGRVIADTKIRPLRALPLGRRMVGQAVTAWCERGDFGAMLHALDTARAGEVVAVDAGGCLQTAYAGEILCGYARARKIAGLVVNGALRDIDTIANWDDFPAFCLGNTAQGPLSKERGAVNGEIVFGGVAVRPGDIVLGDNDGLAIIPLSEARALLPIAQERVRMEASWSAELAKGRTLAEVFALSSEAV
ncbi:RraA family protein [Pseudaminobacter sp. 19-2017]|uniref:Putative 4-hydroxy-4-methyl-2-oxoglutarate aldolase n=1 Tax=Pseudaminobacter soli (ex Zhang et al. 2022) TaxID=2831468 RepID=A0A942E4P1_9HYPH|nr:RraA family protein [Pseudaminobacter soli]MBS3651100.1 RraA family protein [Pseudaminobacter soli]